MILSYVEVIFFPVRSHGQMLNKYLLTDLTDSYAEEVRLTEEGNSKEID